MTPGVDDQAAIVGRGSDVPETSGTLAAGIARWGRRLIPDPERAERLAGGGALSTLTLTAEYVLGTGGEHLSTVRFRDRPERQWWTTGLLGRTRLPTDVPVAVLIGPGTYFSGEALAYHLHTRDRVRLFGRRTPGAADHVTPVRVTPSVVALIPEGTPTDAVSGTNWEGTGVGPDVECAADEAEAVAMAWLLDVMGRAG